MRTMRNRLAVCSTRGSKSTSFGDTEPIIEVVQRLIVTSFFNSVLTYKLLNSRKFHLTSNPKSRAVRWLRCLVAGLSPRSSGFVPGSIHVGFVVDKVAQGQFFLQVLWFSPVNIIPPSFSIVIYHLGNEKYFR
jgi:hypothetical protein